MKQGAAGLILLVLAALILLVIIFTVSKFVIPNPQTVESQQTIEKQAQDAVDKYQQKNVQDQNPSGF